jgi:succinate-semialdehyde dehydrogenase/glutarate-semialdehyde dehydrogenase
VLEDADLTYAAEVCVASRLSNTGQSCIAAKRLIVVESQKVPFERLIVESMKKQTVGNPLSETVTVGPMARSDLRSHLHKQVVGSVARGAKLLLGGELPNGNGFFYPPTVLTDVTPGMPAFDEETFGPVASIIGAKNEVEAISLANRTEFGLGASVFTRNIKKGEKMAKLELEAGAAFVNAAVKSDPRLPMGGIKSSGYGRELSVFGIREFTNIKTVYVK